MTLREELDQAAGVRVIPDDDLWFTGYEHIAFDEDDVEYHALRRRNCYTHDRLGRPFPVFDARHGLTGAGHHYLIDNLPGPGNDLSFFKSYPGPILAPNSRGHGRGDYESAILPGGSGGSRALLVRDSIAFDRIVRKLYPGAKIAKVGSSLGGMQHKVFAAGGVERDGELVFDDEVRRERDKNIAFVSTLASPAAAEFTVSSFYKDLADKGRRYIMIMRALGVDRLYPGSLTPEEGSFRDRIVDRVLGTETFREIAAAFMPTFFINEEYLFRGSNALSILANEGSSNPPLDLIDDIFYMFQQGRQVTPDGDDYTSVAEHLSEGTAPFLFVSGGGDGLTPPDTIDRLALQIQRARTARSGWVKNICVENGGHGPFIGRPAESIFAFYWEALKQAMEETERVSPELIGPGMKAPYDGVKFFEQKLAQAKEKYPTLPLDRVSSAERITLDASVFG